MCALKVPTNQHCEAGGCEAHRKVYKRVNDYCSVLCRACDSIKRGVLASPPPLPQKALRCPGLLSNSSHAKEQTCESRWGYPIESGR